MNHDFRYFFIENTVKLHSFSYGECQPIAQRTMNPLIRIVITQKKLYNMSCKAGKAMQPVFLKTQPLIAPVQPKSGLHR